MYAQIIKVLKPFRENTYQGQDNGSSGKEGKLKNRTQRGTRGPSTVNGTVVAVIILF